MKLKLKTAWRSPRGTLYPSGTMFTKKRDIHTDPGLQSTWYSFAIPSGSYGIVLIPDSVFSLLTPDQLYIRQERKRIVDEHLAAIKDPFLK